MTQGLYLSRRRFLTTATTAIAAPHVISSSALGKDGVAPPSERTTIGMLGVGNRGSSSIRALSPLPEAQIVAIADPRAERRELARKNVDKTYAKRANKASYKACRVYNDFRDLLARDDIDAVWGCAPDHWHGVLYNRVLEAGKDMYGEKPLTRWIAEGFTVCDAVRRYGRVFQTGTQQRSCPQFREACELAINGYLGKIHTVRVGVPGGKVCELEPPCDPPKGFDYDLWTGPAPMIPFDNKRCEWLAMYMISHYCAGFITNWGVHHLDIAGWGCPEIFEKRFEVEGQGILPPGGMSDTWIAWRVEFHYPSGLKLSFTDKREPSFAAFGKDTPRTDLGGIEANESGCLFEGDQGWVRVDRAGIWANPESLLSVRFKPSDMRLHASPACDNDRGGYVSHSADFLRSIRTRQDPVSPVESGQAASTLGNVADIALRLGRKLTWDPTAKRFLNDDDANNMLMRPLRGPWTI
ncbi:MAG: Gfo/Idh/MocA family oxidoreductase [Pirellulaceae bacterium]|nr:Gfo/Idh/MocA family oxidoreductase [Pirellulaceae bacterium]